MVEAHKCCAQVMYVLQDPNPQLLLHPLEEMQPVNLSAGKTADWQDEKVLWTSSETPVLVTYNQVGITAPTCLAQNGMTACN